MPAIVSKAKAGVSATPDAALQAALARTPALADPMLSGARDALDQDVDEVDLLVTECCGDHVSCSGSAPA